MTRKFATLFSVSASQIVSCRRLTKWCITRIRNTLQKLARTGKLVPKSDTRTHVFAGLNTHVRYSLTLGEGKNLQLHLSPFNLSLYLSKGNFVFYVDSSFPFRPVWMNSKTGRNKDGSGLDSSCFALHVHSCFIEQKIRWSSRWTLNCALCVLNNNAETWN